MFRRGGYRYRMGFLVVTLLLMLMLTLSAAAVGDTNRGKIAAMTFDDGPNAKITPALLDELAERGVKCTFFVLGQWAEYYPELVTRAHDEGHQIASHTYSHVALTTQSDWKIQQEVEKTRSTLSELTGEDNFMIRLPYGDGNTSSRVLQYMNAPVILWSVDATNGKTPYTEEQLYQGILEQIYDGAIILMHDTSDANQRAALRAIDTLQAEGWSFVTVEELFRLRGVTPLDNTVYYSVPDAGTYYDENRLSEHWAYDSICYVNQIRLMEGDGVGFKPNEYMTRAMAVTVLWRAMGCPEQEGDIAAFDDVPEGTWYSQPVSWGRQTGVVQGMSENLFQPLDMVTREQFCTMLVRLASCQARTLSGDCADAYSDGFRVSDWARDSVEAVWSAGFVSANETSIFRPQDSLTRAEAAELLAWYDRNGDQPVADEPEEDTEGIPEQPSSRHKLGTVSVVPVVCIAGAIALWTSKKKTCKK